MRVCIIGTGKLGLVTGVCLAHIGHQVICVDNNQAKLELIRSGKLLICEPDLAEMMQSGINRGTLGFTTKINTAIAYSQILFIAVGRNPFFCEGTDILLVERVARIIGAAINEEYKVIVNKSIVARGSDNWICQIINNEIKQRKLDVESQFALVNNPDFFRDGSAIHDSLNPSQIVLGSNSKKAISLMQELYQPIIERKFSTSNSINDLFCQNVPVVVTDLTGLFHAKY